MIDIVWYTNVSDLSAIHLNNSKKPSCNSRGLKRNDRNSSLLKIVSFVVVLSQTYVGLQYGVPHFLDT